MLAERAGVEAGGGEPGLVVVTRRVLRVDAQRHRRRAVAGGDDLLPAVRVGAPQARQPPARMLIARDVVIRQRGGERVTLAQVIAQHAVDQPLENAAGQLADRGNRLVDDHRTRIGTGFQPVQRAEQQRLRLHVTQRLAQQTAEHELAATVAAQHAVGDVLRRGTRRGRFAGEQQQGLGKTLAAMHPG